MRRGGPLPAHVGLDLDNTIIDYEHVFGGVAVALGLLPAAEAGGGKAAVKAALRASAAGEAGWMRVQGKVYGRNIGEARLYPGVVDALRALAGEGVRVSIVSHKTRLGQFDDERVDLWEAARFWLGAQGIIAPGAGGVRPEDVHFLATREAKLARIAEIGCRAFVDDLPEVLLHADFPAGVRPIWFAHDKLAEEGRGLVPLRSWREIGRVLVQAG
jgi:hypothetical protein